MLFDPLFKTDFVNLPVLFMLMEVSSFPLQLPFVFNSHY